MRIVYFARVREAIGFDQEEREVPAGTTIAALVEHMAGQGDAYARAFADPGKLRFALDQHMARPEAMLDGVGELAIFPPVTGG